MKNPPPEEDNIIFTLPPGFRPTPELDAVFTAYCTGGTACELFGGRVDILGKDYAELPDDSGLVLSSSPTNQVSLDGITFRAES